MGVAGEVVPDEVIVTQVGHVAHRISEVWHRANFSFRSALRAARNETYMSAIAGEVSVHDAVPLVSRGDRAGTADAVRYARAGDLRAAGFEVRYRPTRAIKDHVEILWPTDWDPSATVAFIRCFRRCLHGELLDDE